MLLCVCCCTKYGSSTNLAAATPTTCIGPRANYFIICTSGPRYIWNVLRKYFCELFGAKNIKYIRVVPYSNNLETKITDQCTGFYLASTPKKKSRCKFHNCVDVVPRICQEHTCSSETREPAPNFPLER